VVVPGVFVIILLWTAQLPSIIVVGEGVVAKQKQAKGCQRRGVVS